MASPSQQGIILGAYYPSLSMYDLGLRHANLLYTDNYAKYFKPLGIRRYEMMKVMPYMMTSDVLLGLDKPSYLEEDVDYGKSYISNLKERHIDCKGEFIKSIDISVVKPDVSGMSDEQKQRVDVDALTRWYLKINHNVDKLSDKLIDDINSIILCKNKLKVKYLKPFPELCSYVSQKSRIFGETEAKQDILNASVIIEPLHNDMFNMVIPHIPINQSLPIGTQAVINAETPFKGPDSQRHLICSNSLKIDGDIKDVILKEKNNSIFVRPWPNFTHIGSIDLGSAIKGKFAVEEIDVNIHNSFQIYTFRREADDKYFELGMYACYNMLPEDLLDVLIKELPDNEYLKSVKAELKK